jgi:hypothetical protein
MAKHKEAEEATFWISSKLISELREREQKLSRAIAELQAVISPREDGEVPFLKSRRGRKSMGTAERLEVSRRMKQYWARRDSERKCTLTPHIMEYYCKRQCAAELW